MWLVQVRTIERADKLLNMCVQSQHKPADHHPCPEPRVPSPVQWMVSSSCSSNPVLPLAVPVMPLRHVAVMSMDMVWPALLVLVRWCCSVALSGVDLQYAQRHGVSRGNTQLDQMHLKA